MAQQQQQFEEGVTEGNSRRVCVRLFEEAEEKTQGGYKYQGLFYREACANLN